MLSKEEIVSWFKQLQDDICQHLEALDCVEHFKEENWQRPGGGGGRTRVIDGGQLIEKGGVNFSAVEGEVPQKMMQSFHFPEGNFFATGVSLVLHPLSPMVPIIHMNVRYFELDENQWWFGGGIDLTPHYIDEGLARQFHRSLKETCDQHDSSYYSKFKKWADEYFYIPHRQETRGVGGIFFDKLTGGSEDKQKIFDFVKSVGLAFNTLYASQVVVTRDLPYDDEHKKWQLLRRSRYAEFNLVYDRGTKFGLESDGRVESILMSMPPLASWVYDYKATEGSMEEKTLKLLKKDIDWIYA